VNASVWENKGSVHVRDFAGPNAERMALFLPRAVTDASNDPSSALVRESRIRLKQAIRLLARSVHVMCAHEAAELGVIAPANWGPFSQICALTAAIARDNGEVARRATQYTSNVASARPETPPCVLFNSTNATSMRDAPELLEAAIMMQSMVEGGKCDDKGVVMTTLGNFSEGKRTHSAPITSTIAEVSRSKWLRDRSDAHSTYPRGAEPLVFEEDEFEDVDETFFNVDVTDIGIEAWDRVQRVGTTASGVRETKNNDLKRLSAKQPNSLVLPPPPSSSDIEHWERAMLVDKQR
jgi:hypothetical protein